MNVKIVLTTADLKVLAKAPDARKSAVHLVDADDPEAKVGTYELCDADMVLGPVLEVVQYLAAELLAARGALDLRGRAKVAVANHRGEPLPPMTPAMLAAVGIEPQCEYLEDGETVEQRLMRAQRDHERLTVLEEQARTAAVGAERDSLEVQLAGAAACIEALQLLRDSLQRDVERRQRWATTGRW